MQCGCDTRLYSPGVAKGGDDRPLQRLLLMAEAGSLGLRAGQGAGMTFDSLSFNPHRLAWPYGASSTQGNSSTFHFIHFLAGDFLAHHLVEALASCRQLLMKIRLLVFTAF